MPFQPAEESRFFRSEPFVRRSRSSPVPAGRHVEEWLLERESCGSLSAIMVYMPRSRPSALNSILRQLCPRCRTGRIFRSNVHWSIEWGAYWGFPKMNDRCPVCGLLFNREPGYFLGAMYISYALGLALVSVLGATLWLLTGWGFTKVVLWALVIFLPFAPMLTFLSRVLWIYLDQTIDPEMEK